MYIDMLHMYTYIHAFIHTLQSIVVERVHRMVTPMIYVYLIPGDINIHYDY